MGPSAAIGIVTGEAIIGANVFRDMFAVVRDIVGGRSGTYEKALAEARDVALSEMQKRAEQIANASSASTSTTIGTGQWDADGELQRHCRRLLTQRPVGFGARQEAKHEDMSSSETICSPEFLFSCNRKHPDPARTADLTPRPNHPEPEPPGTRLCHC